MGGTRPPRALAAMLGGVVVSLAARDARAQPVPTPVVHLDPAARGSEWFVADSLDLRGHVRSAVGATLDWTHRALLLPDGAGGQHAVLSQQVTLHTGISMVLWERARVAFDLPLQLAADGSAASGTPAFPGPLGPLAVGDPRLSADLRLLGTYGSAITLVVGARAYFAAGDVKSYAAEGDERLAARAMVAGDVAPFVYSAQLGATVRDVPGAFGTGHAGSYLTYGASFGVRVLRGAMVLGPEVFGRVVIAPLPSTAPAALLGPAATSAPLEGILGGHYTLLRQLRLGLGVGARLTETLGTPVARGILSVDWAPPPPDPPPFKPPDADRDGVVDVEDACPQDPGVRTNDPTTNGCPPPPPDLDGDEIVDSEDACPDLAGVRTGDPKTHGCPPPPPDRDGDGIDDTDDACVDVPGVRTLDPKTHGCPPNPDRDRDGIPNESDACPDEAGKPDPDPTRNGCPRAFVSAEQIVIRDQVLFKTGLATIVAGPQSESILVAVRDVLREHPEIPRVRVEGHTDSRGAAAANKKLSAARAAAVVQWLVAHGTEQKRLTSAGFGSERPLGSNATDLGRAQNRRVEFHIERTLP